MSSRFEYIFIESIPRYTAFKTPESLSHSIDDWQEFSDLMNRVSNRPPFYFTFSTKHSRIPTISGFGFLGFGEEQNEPGYYFLVDPDGNGGHNLEFVTLEQFRKRNLEEES